MNQIKKVFNRTKTEGICNTTKHYINLLLTYLYLFALKIIEKFPLRNTIVFECESDMDDNPRAIYEYMVKAKLYRKYRLVWIVKNLEFCRENYPNKNTVFVSRISEKKSEILRFNYYMSTGKYFLFSHPYWFVKKKKEQIVVHTTHGTPFKDTPNNTGVENTFDYELSATKFTQPWILKVLNCTADRSFICDHPRNDFMFSVNKADVIPKLFNWQSDEKVIMCMPTFKQSKFMHDCDVIDKFSLTVVEAENELIELNNMLNEYKIHLIVKLHPLQSTDVLSMLDLSNIHYIQNAELFNKKILLYNLLGCCDALITDFSSVFFDYIQLDRQIAFFTKYFDEYNRGYVMDNPKDYLVGENINTYADLINFIKNVNDDNDTFKAERHNLNDLLHKETAHNRCKKFTEILFNLKVRNQ